MKIYNKREISMYFQAPTPWPPFSYSLLIEFVFLKKIKCRLLLEAVLELQLQIETVLHHWDSKTLL